MHTHPESDLASHLAESHREFLSFLERRLGDRALAEDILQDAFVKSIEKAGALREDEAATGWFYRVLRNAVVDHYRRGSVRNRALEQLAREMEGAAELPEAMQPEVCACVGRLAATLKPEYADAIQRVEVDGAPLAAFAEEAGITANNAAVRLFRAREALRKQVNASCRTCAEHGCFDCTCA
ncbi:MAG TPA: RNA polymerase sigma factor [Thermoanaerobaculia bacterium]|jgi:RNA polymerase sigma-70 factor (ECF subfamily)